MRLVYLYGIAGYEDKYRIVRYARMDFNKYPPKELVREIKLQIAWLKSHDSAIEEVYMIDDRGGLGNYYWRTVKDDTIEGNLAFRDMLEREGQRLPI